MKKIINNFISSPLMLQIMKFGIVGGIAFLIDFSLLYLFVDIFYWEVLISAAISFTISLIVNYLLSMKFVFHSREDISKRKETIIFVVTSIIGLTINEIVMHLGVDGLEAHYMLVKIGSTAIVMIWNFVSKKVLLEKKKKIRC